MYRGGIYKIEVSDNKICRLEIITNDSRGNLKYEDTNEMIGILNKTTFNKLNIYINSSGGDLEIYLNFASKLLNLIRDKGECILCTYADPKVYSAAILIWLCANKSNRHMDLMTGQLVFHPILCDTECKMDLGGFLKKQTYKFVKNRTGLTEEQIVELYEGKWSYQIIGIEHARELELIE